MIKVLFEGLHTNHYRDDGSYGIDPLCSSVTLIRTPKRKNVIVDTGMFFYHREILAALKKEGLKPEEVHYVLNTHFHLDHTSNNWLFPKAVVCVGQACLMNTSPRGEIYGDFSENQNPFFPQEIEDLPTPGHMLDHHAYVYRENGVTYVMGGDAVREDLIRKKVVPHAHDRSLYYESLKKIFEVADVIIPGHFRVIEGDLKEELYSLVKRMKF